MDRDFSSDELFILISMHVTVPNLHDSTNKDAPMVLLFISPISSSDHCDTTLSSGALG